MNVYVVLTSYLLHFDYGEMFQKFSCNVNNSSCRKIILKAADQQRNNEEETGAEQNTDDHVVGGQNMVDNVRRMSLANGDLGKERL
jgi:hypothetical protein